MSKARRSHNKGVIPKDDTAWRQGIFFLGRSVASNEYLLGRGGVSLRCEALGRHRAIVGRPKRRLRFLCLQRQRIEERLDKSQDAEDESEIGSSV